MKITHYLFGILFFCICSFVGCSKPVSREIEGEVFIVHPNRETLKLSLVEVHAVDKQTADRLFAENSNWETNALFKTWIDLLADNENQLFVAQTMPSLIDNFRSLQDAQKRAALAERTRLQQLKSIMPEKEFDKRWKENEARIRETAQTSNVNDYAGPSVQKLKEKQTEAFRILQSATVEKTKTDADGRFSFNVQNKTNLLLFAYVQKEGGQIPEEYLWVCPVEEKPKQRILLSSDNLLTAK